MAKEINERLKDNEPFHDFDTNNVFAVDALEYIGPGSLSGAVGSWSLAEGDVEKSMGALRDSLGNTIAMGTDGSRELAVDQTWVEQLTKIGKTLVWFQGGKKPASEELPTKPAGKGEDFYGWVSLAPLLRHGDFDPEFLSTVAIDIIEFDQELSDDKRKYWESDGKFDNENAKDPVEPVLAALDNSAEALKLVDDQIDDPRIDKLVEKT